MKLITKLLFLLLIIGCYVDDDKAGLNTIINLTVEDALTGNKLLGEKFILEDCSSEFTIKDDCSVIEDLESDSLGKTKVELINELNRTYNLRYEPSGLWYDYDYMSPVFYKINEGEENNITFKIKPTIQLGIHFIHEGALGFESFGYNVNRVTDNDDGYSTYLGFQGSGFGDLSLPIDTIIYRPIMQTERYIIDGSLKDSNSERIEIIKEILAPEADTIMIEFIF